MSLWAYRAREFRKALWLFVLRVFYRIERLNTKSLRVCGSKIGLKMKNSGIKLSSLWLYIKVCNDRQLQARAIGQRRRCKSYSDVFVSLYQMRGLFVLWPLGGSGSRARLILVGSGPSPLNPDFRWSNEIFSKDLVFVQYIVEQKKSSSKIDAIMMSPAENPQRANFCIINPISRNLLGLFSWNSCST